MTKEIHLTQGQIALVDDEDYERVMQLKWFSQKVWGKDQFYARAYVALQNIIMSCPPDMVVDHIDHNTLNCQKINLRLATPLQNRKNRSKQRNNTSGFKGVSFEKKVGRYKAYISSDKKRYHLGYFNTAEEAAHIYDSAALKLHGEFALLNFP